MTIKVLVVDDSNFFRKRVTEILMSDKELEVVGTAENGLDAVQKTIKLKPDVITMDIEMPVLDGIGAVRRIMASKPTPIIMFSSLSYAGAEATLEALDAGAMDFLPKKFEDVSRDSSAHILCAKIKTLALRKSFLEKTFQVPQLGDGKSAQDMKASIPGLKTNVKKTLNQSQNLNAIQIVIIGTSTGGPAALQKILQQIPTGYHLPIILIQHMPATFTYAFAQRLNQMSKIRVKEAEDNDVLEAGSAYLAPGGKQLEFIKIAGRYQIKIKESKDNETYRPSVDITFSSAAELFGSHVLGIVMTGMGSDGREGARLLKKNGSVIWAQNEATCVVYGMPMSIIDAGLADAILALPDIGPNLVEKV